MNNEESRDAPIFLIVNSVLCIIDVALVTIGLIMIFGF